jgi:WD40 repeat protein
MDYHLGKRIVITVSKDKTIRLWDLATMDQVYEFSSPVDQALCVAAHP